MKLRQSGMPGEAYWESLFDIPLILDRLGIDVHLGDVVELGCGYGTFTIPVARRIAGTLESIDIDPEMVEHTRERAARAGVSNLVLRQRDVFVEGFGGPPQSRDACLLFNILHCEEPVRLLAEAACTRLAHLSGARFVHGDAANLPFPTGTFDVALAITVLCFSRDVEKVTQEMYRVLRPGGRLVVGELGKWSSWTAVRRLRAFATSSPWQRAHFFSPGDHC
jgi:ubiquinone/menaquinone biosynthesis C-methylase UbiE